MAVEVLDPLSGGVGGGVGGLIGALFAKWFVNKSEKEITEIKKQLLQNEKADSLRDIAIAVLQENNKNIEKNLVSIDSNIQRILEKLEK
jgi:Na+/glutamate symporter